MGFSSVDISQFVVPVYPTPPPSNPVAGQPTSIDCIVSAAGLTNSDIQWVGPANTVISATSGRVSVGNVFQDQATGRSVRRLTFNPLSTEDSGPYTCVSSQGSSSQIITVNGIITTQSDSTSLSVSYSSNAQYHGDHCTVYPCGWGTTGD